MTDHLVLVANQGDDTIGSFLLTGGALTPLVRSPILGCSTFAVDERRDLVFASSKQGPSVVTLRLDRADGSLSELSRCAVEDASNYLTLTPDGRMLLSASYHGGFGTSSPVSDAGVVAPAVSRIAHANTHSVAVTADGRFAYFVSLGEDLLAQCALGEDGSLTPLDPPTAPAPPGTGPRHLLIDRAGTTVYVLTEFTAEVLRYRRDPESGTLRFIEAVATADPAAGLGRSAFGLDPRAGHLIWGADLHLSLDESILWASERTASTLATLPVMASGALKPPLAFVTTEPQPRGFAVSPDGHWLVAAGERSTTVSLYDLSHPVPRFVGQAATGAGANWVRIIPR
ncbi:MAG: beta-propeller fold lactonase family protein [Propionibacterium sp.]|nr:beta-propeller fold lactonase family protein [Propionibacterium sp.]